MLVLIAFWYGIAVILSVRRPFCYNRQGVLKERLRAYAKMRGRYGEVEQPSPAAGVELSPCDHAILLGILKKVEAKNATMVSVWAFIFSALITGASFTNDLAIQKTAALLLLGVLPFVLAAICGTRQLDNYSNAVKRHVYKEVFVRELQKELMRDALDKEAYFAFSRTGAGVFLIVLVGCVAIFFLGKGAIVPNPFF